ncbi:MAG TPA: hypothetical protein VNS58_31405 [Puia sp.]|nr:hypothetical protein [Puia sp.]
MKTVVLFLCACLTGSMAHSQWTLPDASNNIHNTNTGFVGIGVTNPTAALHVAYEGFPSLSVAVTGNRANATTQLSTSLAVIADNNTQTSSSGAVAWDFYNNGTNPSWSGALLEHVGTAVTGNQYGVLAANQGELLFQNVSNGVIASNGANIFISPLGTVSACFLTNGNVGIGTTNPGTNKLAVEGTIGARKVIVTLSNPFPDYVFKPGYELPSLKSVEKYIAANGRLQDMPSADSVAQHGLDLGNTQAKLLEKIEQLTLYTIDLQKQVGDMQKQIDELKKKKH